MLHNNCTSVTGGRDWKRLHMIKIELARTLLNSGRNLITLLSRRMCGRCAQEEIQEKAWISTLRGNGPRFWIFLRFTDDFGCVFTAILLL